MFLFYSIHYPQPEKEELWVQKMRQFDELMKKQPGIIFVSEKRSAHRLHHLGISGSFPGILARFGERGPFW